MALIFIASSVPDPGPLPGDVSDKTGHFAAYAVLSATILRGFAHGRLSGVTWRRIVASTALSTMYGAADEVHQMMVPGRTPDGQDVVADAVGALAGAMAVLAIKALLVRRDALERYTRSD
jgi:VanZ family protein